MPLPSLPITTSVHTESAIVRSIRAFKRDLMHQDAKAMNAMATQYMSTHKALSKSIDELVAQIVAKQQAGVEVGRDMFYRLDRFERLMNELEREMLKYNKWSADYITTRQMQAAKFAADNAAEIARKYGSGILKKPKIPVGAGEAMAGLAGDETPLGTLLAESGNATRQAVMNALQNGINVGQSPAKMAANMRQACNIPFQRSLTIGRTETLRAYRESSLQIYREMGVTQYQRIASLDERTCLGCALEDGMIYKTEQEFEEHVCGRCDCVPIIPGHEAPAQQNYQQWFNAQSPARQERILGPTRYEALTSGAVQWQDLARHVIDPVWGGSFRPSTLKELGLTKGFGKGKGGQLIKLPPSLKMQTHMQKLALQHAKTLAKQANAKLKAQQARLAAKQKAAAKKAAAKAKAAKKLEAKGLAKAKAQVKVEQVESAAIVAKLPSYVTITEEVDDATTTIRVTKPYTPGTNAQQDHVLDLLTRNFQAVEPELKGMPDIEFFKGGKDPFTGASPANWSLAGGKEFGIIKVNIESEAWADLKGYMTEYENTYSTTEVDHFLRHELMHAAQYQQTSWDVFHALAPHGMTKAQEEKELSKLTALWKAHPGIGKYAGLDSPVEFLAEIATAMSYGRTFTPDVMKAYRGYGGIKVKAFKAPKPEKTLKLVGKPKFMQVKPEDFTGFRERSARPAWLTDHDAKWLHENKAQCFKLPGYDAGYALYHDPENGGLLTLISVHNNSDLKGCASAILADADRHGAQALDCYDRFLNSLYGSHGWQEVERWKWTDAYAPTDKFGKVIWDYQKHDRPDVVLMQKGTPAAKAAKESGLVHPKVPDDALTLVDLMQADDLAAVAAATSTADVIHVFIENTAATTAQLNAPSVKAVWQWSKDRVAYDAKMAAVKTKAEGKVVKAAEAKVAKAEALKPPTMLPVVQEVIDKLTYPEIQALAKIKDADTAGAWLFNAKGIATTIPQAQAAWLFAKDRIAYDEAKSAEAAKALMTKKLNVPHAPKLPASLEAFPSLADLTETEWLELAKAEDAWMWLTLNNIEAGFQMNAQQFDAVHAYAKERAAFIKAKQAATVKVEPKPKAAPKPPSPTTVPLLTDEAKEIVDQMTYGDFVALSKVENAGDAGKWLLDKGYTATASQAEATWQYVKARVAYDEAKEAAAHAKLFPTKPTPQPSKAAVAAKSEVEKLAEQIKTDDLLAFGATGSDLSFDLALGEKYPGLFLEMSYTQRHELYLYAQKAVADQKAAAKAAKAAAKPAKPATPPHPTAEVKDHIIDGDIGEGYLDDLAEMSKADAIVNLAMSNNYLADLTDDQLGAIWHYAQDRAAYQTAAGRPVAPPVIAELRKTAYLNHYWLDSLGNVADEAAGIEAVKSKLPGSAVGKFTDAQLKQAWEHARDLKAWKLMHPGATKLMPEAAKPAPVKPAVPKTANVNKALQALEAAGLKDMAESEAYELLSGFASITQVEKDKAVAKYMAAHKLTPPAKPAVLKMLQDEHYAFTLPESITTLADQPKQMAIENMQIMHLPPSALAQVTEQQLGDIWEYAKQVQAYQMQEKLAVESKLAKLTATSKLPPIPKPSPTVKGIINSTHMMHNDFLYVAGLIPDDAVTHLMHELPYGGVGRTRAELLKVHEFCKKLAYSEKARATITAKKAEAKFVKLQKPVELPTKPAIPENLTSILYDAIPAEEEAAYLSELGKMTQEDAVHSLRSKIAMYGGNPRETAQLVTVWQYAKDLQAYQDVLAEAAMAKAAAPAKLPKLPPLAKQPQTVQHTMSGVVFSHDDWMVLAEMDEGPAMDNMRYWSTNLSGKTNSELREVYQYAKKYAESWQARHEAEVARAAAKLSQARIPKAPKLTAQAKVVIDKLSPADVMEFGKQPTLNDAAVWLRHEQHGAWGALFGTGFLADAVKTQEWNNLSAAWEYAQKARERELALLAQRGTLRTVSPLGHSLNVLDENAKLISNHALSERLKCGPGTSDTQIVAYKDKVARDLQARLSGDKKWEKFIAEENSYGLTKVHSKAEWMESYLQSHGDMVPVRPGMSAKEVAALRKATAEAQWKQREYSQVKDLVHQWAISSADNNEDSLLLQLIAKDLFKLGDAATQHWEVKSAFKDAKRSLRTDKEKVAAFRSFLRAQYENTQAILAEQGMESVVLYRGACWSETTLASMGVRSVDGFKTPVILTCPAGLQPMSAWSIDQGIAYNFEHHGQEAIGSVVVCRVPRERIIGSFTSGFGCTGESEYVVLGDNFTVAGGFWDAGHQPGMSAFYDLLQLHVRGIQ